MKRRIFSLFLAIIMTATTVDVTAFAQESSQKEMETVVEEETSVEESGEDSSVEESMEYSSVEEGSIEETSEEEETVEIEEETTSVESEETEVVVEETKGMNDLKRTGERADNYATGSGNYGSDWRYWTQCDSSDSNIVTYGCRIVSFAKLLTEAGFSVGNPDEYFSGVGREFFNSGYSEIGEFGSGVVGTIKKLGGEATKSQSHSLSGNLENDKATIMSYLRNSDNSYILLSAPDPHTAYILRNESLQAGYPIISETSYSNNIRGASQVKAFNGKTCGGTSFTNFRIITVGINNNSLPKLNVDSCTGGNKSITVRGWAFDYDDVNTPVEIHVYVGGPAGNGREAVASFLANKEGTDIPKHYPGVGNYHRFEKTISVNVTGNQPVYVYALNLGGPEGFTEVACSAHIFSLPNATNSVPNGNYHILSVVDPRYRVDVPGVGNPASGTKVMLHEAYPELNEAFSFTYNGDGTYRITKGNTSLDVTGASSVAGTPIQMHDNNDSEAQKWILDPQNKTDYNFVSICNGYNMDLNYGIAKEGGEITSYPRGLGDNQKWRLLPEGKRTIADGKYYIQSAKNHEYGLYVTEKNPVEMSF